MCYNTQNMAVMLHIMLIVFLSLCIRKKEFIQPDGISITQLEEDIGRPKETYAFSAIWCFKQCNGTSSISQNVGQCACFCC